MIFFFRLVKEEWTPEDGLQANELSTRVLKIKIISENNIFLYIKVQCILAINRYVKSNLGPYYLVSTTYLLLFFLHLAKIKKKIKI